MAAPLGTGSYVALVTPMLQGGAVDMAALEKLLKWHVAEGTNGSFPSYISFYDFRMVGERSQK